MWGYQKGLHQETPNRKGNGRPFSLRALFLIITVPHTALVVGVRAALLRNDKNICRTQAQLIRFSENQTEILNMLLFLFFWAFERCAPRAPEACGDVVLIFQPHDTEWQIRRNLGEPFVVHSPQQWSTKMPRKFHPILWGSPKLEGREPPLTLRQESQYCILATFSPVRQGLFPCSTALFLKNSHREGPVLQEFGFVLRAGVWQSTSVVQAVPWG